MKDFLMDGHKLYWHLDRVVDWQAEKIIPPIYVEISPVSYCNHKCIFCGLDFARSQQYRLDTDTLCSRLTEMAHSGVKSVMFAGEGEPLLHDDLPVIVQHAKRVGLDVAITTNGTTGTEKLWEALLPCLSWLRFSIDAANAATYTKVHKVPEISFGETITSLKSALAIRKNRKLATTIGVQFLLIQENLEDTEQALQLYSGLNVDYLSLKPYSEHPQMLNKSGFNYTEEMMERIAAAVASFRGKTETKLIFRKTATASYVAGNKEYDSCNALPFWGYISSKGDFYTCSVFLNDERFSVGNIYKQDMETILFGEKRRKSIEYGRKQLLVGNECRLNCRMARINEFLHSIKDKPDHINFI